MTPIWPYIPQVVVVAADGVVWTIGWVRENGPFNVLKRFDTSGKLLDTRVLKVKPSEPNGRDAAWTSILRSSVDTIGWLTAANEYIEFGLDGGELARYGLPDAASPYDFITTSFGLSDKNQAVLIAADLEDKSKRRASAFILNRDKRAWENVRVSGQSLRYQERIVGFAGDSLITYRSGISFSKLVRWKLK